MIFPFFLNLSSSATLILSLFFIGMYYIPNPIITPCTVGTTPLRSNQQHVIVCLSKRLLRNISGLHDTHFRYRQGIRKTSYATIPAICRYCLQVRSDNLLNACDGRMQQQNNKKRWKCNFIRTCSSALQQCQMV